MFQNNLKIAIRNLTRNRGFSFINILGLAVGMAIAIIIGLWIHNELTYNNIHSTKDRVVRAKLHYSFDGKHNISNAMPIPLAEELRTNFSADFEKVSITSWIFDRLLAIEDKNKLEVGMAIEPPFLDIMDIEMVQGERSKVLQETFSMILNEKTAKSLFGDANPIGQVIRMDDADDYKVTGIFKDLPENSTFAEVNLFTTWAAHSRADWIQSLKTDWNDHSFQTYALLTPNANIDDINQRIKDVEANHTDQPVEPELFIHPMEKWHLYSQFIDGVNTGGRIQYVWLFGIIGAFVLFLACINFMNLSTAQSERRAKEVGVRKTIGSSRRELITQFFTESYLVVGIAVVLGLVLVRLALPSFSQIADKELHILWNEPLFWLSLFLFTFITGLLAGSYPAFFLSSFQPLQVLKNSFKNAQAVITPRKVLVVIQFTVSIALIVGTVVVFQQIEHAKSRTVGYDRTGILQVNMITAEIAEKFDIIRDRLNKSQFIQEVSHSNSPMTGIWSNTGGLVWKGSDPNSPHSFANTGVSHEYGKTIDWKITQGRDFSRAFGSDTSAMILNQAAVDLMGIENIVGETIKDWRKNTYQVIGVVENILQDDPFLPVKPSIYRLDDRRKNVLFIKMTPDANIQTALNEIGGVFKTVVPNTPFDYSFVDEDFDRKFRREEQIGSLARVFAILAILISCLGLFGLSAYVAERRTKEIGIRKVLGASVLNLWTMLSKEFVVLVAIACLVATPLAYYYLNNWLDGYEYRVELSWSVFAWAGVAAIIITILTVSFQGIKAALMNPVKSIQSE